jgi:hypothetical protein
MPGEPEIAPSTHARVMDGKLLADSEIPLSIPIACTIRTVADERIRDGRIGPTGGTGSTVSTSPLA